MIKQATIKKLANIVKLSSFWDSTFKRVAREMGYFSEAARNYHKDEILAECRRRAALKRESQQAAKQKAKEVKNIVEDVANKIKKNPLKKNPDKKDIDNGQQFFDFLD